MEVAYTIEYPANSHANSIFLAGPTPRIGSNTPSWRPRAINILKEKGFDGIVFLPESRTGKINWTSEAQVNWEQKCLDMSDCILFWVPRDLVTLPGFTTNIEFGTYLHSGKIVFGAPPYSPKTGYMRHCCRKFNIPHSETLEETIDRALGHLGMDRNKDVRSRIEYKFCPHCGRKLAHLIEEEKTRKFCQHCIWTYYPTEGIAPVAIMKRRGEILLVQRNREPHKGKWQLPSGFKDYGETTLDALKRELKEELGIKMIVAQPFKELRSDDDPRNSGTMVPFYQINGWEGKIINNEPDENSAFGWFDPTCDLPPIAWKTHEEVLISLGNS